MPAPAARPKTVLLVRHAEKAGEVGDVSLSPAGRQRAEDLAVLLGAQAIQYVVCSNWRRTLETAQPILAAKDATLVRIPTNAHYLGELQKVIAGMSSGETALVVSHVQYLELILNLLGVRAKAAIDDDYQHLFVIAVPAHGPASLLHLHYGAARAS